MKEKKENPQGLPEADSRRQARHYQAAEREAYWRHYWQQKGCYHYRGPEGRRFSIDTPPPTVSGSLHIGHIFSYTHTDILARYKRMQGYSVFYPIGWDDNGLPTERRVQNYYGITCDPSLPYDPQLRPGAEPPTGREARAVSRRNFIEHCNALTAQDEQVFKELWQRIGLSVDWRKEYATIDSRSRRYAQYSFIDLYGQGQIYSQEAPILWDVDFQTAVAQAEVEDRQESSRYYRIRFRLLESREEFFIATTRPELLPACVGITAHPGDERYRRWFGKRALSPLFGVTVPVFASDQVDPGQGTGILMVCTFGDAADIEWWRRHELPLRQIITPQGRLRSISFGRPPWDSLQPEPANRCYRRLAGKTIHQARQATVELLRQETQGFPGIDLDDRRPLLGESSEEIRHWVRYYEKGQKPLEYLSSRQWFVRLLDKKELLLRLGEQVRWHPPFMGIRYRNWVENLNLDWCISRQRYFGVPFPLWYHLDARSHPAFNRPILADPQALPMDPMIDCPPGHASRQRNQARGFQGEVDVLDTWFTSSLTPQIATSWLDDPEQHRYLFPLDLRPQSHEIIRTWTFYTIVKAALHGGTIPWRRVAVSGWVTDPERKKMSKSRGNVQTPQGFLQRFTADGVRYWAASAALGTDTALDEGMMKNGKRLVTKLYNAAKFIHNLEGQVLEGEQAGEELDRSFLLQLKTLCRSCQSLLDRYQYSRALAETEHFFWSRFTGSYLELVKNRAKGAGSRRGQASALFSLRLGLNLILRLFAPFLPFICEEIWSWSFSKRENRDSIHLAPWPGDGDFKGLTPPKNRESLSLAAACLSKVHGFKTRSGISLGAELDCLVIQTAPEQTLILQPLAGDLQAACRARQFALEAAPGLAEGILVIAQAEIA